jgi:hypothetical protein
MDAERRTPAGRRRVEEELTTHGAAELAGDVEAEAAAIIR